MTTWTADSYSRNTGHHRRFDEGFLSGWPLPGRGTVLDIGCGVGDFTIKLATDDRRVVGVDASPDLIAEATGRFGDRVEFRIGQAQNLDMIGDASMDAVVSRAALHWIAAADHPRMLAEVARVLVPGGWFRAEFAAAGQMPEVLAILDSELAARGLAGQSPFRPWYFAEQDDYAQLLANAGLSVQRGWLRTVDQVRTYTDGELDGWLDSQIVNAYEPRLDPADRADFADCVRRRCHIELARSGSDHVVAFRRMCLLAQRPPA